MPLNSKVHIANTTANPANTSPAQDSGERNPGTANQYGVGNPESEYALVTADTDVSTSAAATLYGVTVIVATATNVIEIRNSTSAGAGDVVLSIPASAAVGTYYECNGVMMDTGLYADFTGTGTLRIDWRAQ